MSASDPPPSADPNMADVYTAFHLDSTPHKRKRHLDDLNDDLISRQTKRRSFHCLPIRSSPSRPFSLFTSIYQQPPTPVDTSDDESPSLPKRPTQDQDQREDQDLDHWPQNNSQPGSDSSLSSIRAQCGDSVDADIDMELTTMPPVQPRIRRARSNDIVPPHRDSNFLSAMDSFARERVPTPISSNFDNRINDLPSVPRHQFPPLRTNLSPMFEQESWITRDGLPSPVDDQDMDTAMMIDADDDGEFGMRMRGGDAADTGMAGKFGLQLDGTSSPGRVRTARLHMGFLNDCDKCVQKVPGHYSHIIWS